MVDLDRFKEVNDTFGHHYGDLLLQGLGPHLRDALCGLGTLARIGGDEFGILLPGADGARAIQTAEAVLEAVRRPIVVKGQALEVGASIGIALCPEHAHDPIALMQCADIAMYAAKRAKAGYLVYAADQSEFTPRRVAMIGELRRGIEEDQLRLHYQPKIDLRTFAVEGVEALVRWLHPRMGCSPRRVHRDGRGHRPDHATEPLGAAHGVDAMSSLASDRGRRQRRGQSGGGRAEGSRTGRGWSLRNWRAPTAIPDWLTLEITESAVMTDPVQARRRSRDCAASGVRISIDDFGTGYSSLAYLRDLPVDEIKIDRSFVKEMATRDQDACIVRSIIDLGHNLGLRVVAEGVEDRATVELLATMGCDYVQGFHFARPLPAADFASWLAGTQHTCHRALPPCRPLMQDGRQSLLRSEARGAESGAKP